MKWIKYTGFNKSFLTMQSGLAKYPLADMCSIMNIIWQNFATDSY